MNSTSGYLRILAIVGVFLIVQGGLPSSVRAKTLTIATISDNPPKDLKYYAPFAKHLARKLAGHGITQGRAVMAGSMREMAAMMKQGKVDVFFDSPMTGMVVNHLSGSKMILRRWKKGVASYHSVIFVRSDSDIRSIPDLRSRTMAFEEPFSSSSYLLPRASLMLTGMNMTKLPKPEATPLSDRIGYVFSFDDKNTMDWVLSKRVDVGAMSYNTFREESPTSGKGLRILLETIPVPRHTVNVRSGIPDDLQKALEDVLTSMHHDRQGKTVLTAFEKTVQFDRVSKTSRAQMKRLFPYVLEVFEGKK